MPSDRPEKPDIFQAEPFRGLSNLEQIRLLAEAFHYTLQFSDAIRICDMPECGARVRRGKRCEPCVRAQRAAFERARYWKRKSQEQ